MVSPRVVPAALAAALLLVAAACGPAEDSEADVRDRIEAQLRANGLDDDAATCVAKVLVDELGKKAIEDVALNDTEPDGPLDPELSEAALTARSTCKVDITALGDR